MSESLFSHFYTSPQGHKLKVYQSFHELEQVDKERPIIVFRHGNGMSVLCYWPFLKHFLSDYELVLIEAQAHGLSERGKGFRGWDKACDEVAPLLNSLAGRPVIAMGHSYGAVLSLLSASRLPKLYQQVVALDPVVFPRWAAATITKPGLDKLWRRVHPLARQARKRRNGWADREQAHQYFYRRGMFKSWHDEAFEAYLDSALVEGGKAGAGEAESRLSLACPPWMEARIFASYPKRIWQELERIKMPSLYLHGDNTFGFIPGSGKKLARRNRMIECQEVEGDHCFMQAQPDEVATRVLAWLKQH